VARGTGLTGCNAWAERRSCCKCMGTGAVVLAARTVCAVTQGVGVAGLERCYAFCLRRRQEMMSLVRVSQPHLWEAGLMCRTAQPGPWF